MDPAGRDCSPPHWTMLGREIGAVLHPRRLRVPREAVARGVGEGRPVLIIPGFLASDGSVRPLRVALREAGFRAHGWKQGRNFGLDERVFERVEERVQAIAHGARVALVGWSLGGLVAREYAKRHPEQIAKVVTLGSPICGDPRRNNNVWRLYEPIAGHPVDAPPVDCVLEEKPPVETVAIWSRRDGIVAAHGARAAGCADRSIEIGCGHIEMVFAPEAIRAVIDALG